MGRTTRRTLLKTGGGLVTAGILAGCTGSLPASDASETKTVRTSFAVLHDFTRAVVGDATTVENLVPVGQHGHGWEPSAQVQRDVLDAGAFVYVASGFQPWADDALENVRNERPAVTTVEASHGIDLLPVPGSGDHGSHGDHDSEEDGHDGHEEDSHSGHGNRSDHEGTSHEAADHDGPSSHENRSGDDHRDESHGHGATDPHFWLDPVRAKQAVTNVEDGLAKMDGANRETLAANADGYRTKLDELDETFRSKLGGAKRDAVLVAGHNAFQYLGDRYGFEVHSLTDLAPDDAPSPKDVRRAQELISRHDVEYVLAPVFESDRAAKRLVVETGASDHLPITSIPGTTREWDERGWGYLDVMEQVNLASLTTALGGT